MLTRWHVSTDGFTPASGTSNALSIPDQAESLAFTVPSGAPSGAYALQGSVAGTFTNLLGKGGDDATEYSWTVPSGGTTGFCVAGIGVEGLQQVRMTAPTEASGVIDAAFK